MTRTKVDTSLEKQFITAMVTSKAFLLSNHMIIDPELYTAKYLKLVATWCLSYFNEYQQAPGRTIESMFHAWVDAEQPQDEDREAVSDFLSSLSESHDESPELNPAYLSEKHIQFVRTKRLSKLAEKILYNLEIGDQAGAATAVTDHRDIINTGDTGYNPMVGRDRYERAFAKDRTGIIDMPNEARDFFGSTLVRGGFLGIQGSAKRKKTYFLYDMAYRALLSGLRVAFFQVGDLIEEEQDLRWAVRIAQHPIHAEDCAGVQFPVSLTLTPGPKGPVPEVSYMTKTFREPLNAETAYQAVRKFYIRQKFNKSDIPPIMFSIHPTTTINVRGIHSILKRWEQELEFLPDLIICDYADILAPENPKLQKLDQVNETWQRLRRLSQEWNALVITPTQANKASYTAKTQSALNVADNQLKLAHVTGMLGLSQTNEEIAQNIQRWNWINRRTGRWNAKDTLWVSQCLPLGIAMVRAVRGFSN